MLMQNPTVTSVTEEDATKLTPYQRLQVILSRPGNSAKELKKFLNLHPELAQYVPKIGRRVRRPQGPPTT